MSWAKTYDYVAINGKTIHVDWNHNSRDGIYILDSYEKDDINQRWVNLLQDDEKRLLSELETVLARMTSISFGSSCHIIL